MDRIRNLQDIYEATDRIDYLTMFCLFADYELVNFQEVEQERKWRYAMHEEVKSIEKNDMWELTSLSKGLKAISAK